MKNGNGYARNLERSFAKEEWFNFLSPYDIPVSKVNDIGEAFNVERGMLQEIEDPELGKVKQVGFPIKFSQTPGQIRSMAPYPGQHTQEILHCLGYDEARIGELIQRDELATYEVIDND